MLAMDRAIKKLNPAADFALIDGNRNQGIELQNEMVVHGDARSASIAAASILAKVSRDRFMVELAEQYPQYAFETRATPLSSTTSCCASMAPVPSTARPS